MKPWLHGPTGTGKTWLFEVQSALAGDQFVHVLQDGEHADKFSLNYGVVKARAIQDTETLPLTVESIRKMVGGEKVGGVRDMRIAPQSKTPKGQLIAYTNDAPAEVLNGNDKHGAMANRIFPFRVDDVQAEDAVADLQPKLAKESASGTILVTCLTTYMDVQVHVRGTRAQDSVYAPLDDERADATQARPLMRFLGCGEFTTTDRPPTVHTVTRQDDTSTDDPFTTNKAALLESYNAWRKTTTRNA
jgi:phage/plasmid-associated DNA primase